METASRLRSRIEAVIDYGFVAEGVDRRNPAAFRGNLEHRGVGRPKKIAPVVHHPAAPYAEIPAIMAELRELTGTTPLCLLFTILTWARSPEGRGARWAEMSRDLTLWSLPAGRVKAHRAHDVPLSEEAQEILAQMRKRRMRESEPVFPGPGDGIPSDVGLNKVLHGLPTVVRLDQGSVLMSGPRAGAKRPHGATIYGMHSAARSWAAAQTEFAPFVAELALAHVNKDRVEAADQRDRVLEKRKALPTKWGEVCRSPVVVPIPQRGAG